MAPKQKKKTNIGQVIAMIVMMLLGAAIGVVGMEILERSGLLDAADFGITLIRMGLLLLLLYLALYIQIIVHEGGHLIAGRMSGYDFVSFRIASFIWVKQEDGVKLRRLRIAGTGGQCLMSPPELIDGKMPYVLYNLGGSLANLAATLVFGVLWLIFPEAAWLSIFCVSMAVVGIAYALMNGIPMRLGAVDNDGWNAISLGKSPDTLRAFWLQLRVNERQASGMRLREMPAEWFALPPEASMDNGLTATVAAMACNRLLDEGRLAEADALMERMLSMDSGMIGLHRNLLICDRICCELLGANDPEKIKAFCTKEQLQFMKSMKQFPSVIRTRYLLAKLGTKDEKEASKYRKGFEKIERTYPHPVELTLERELMAMGDAKAAV